MREPIRLNQTAPSIPLQGPPTPWRPLRVPRTMGCLRPTAGSALQRVRCMGSVSSALQAGWNDAVGDWNYATEAEQNYMAAINNLSEGAKNSTASLNQAGVSIVDTSKDVIDAALWIGAIALGIFLFSETSSESGRSHLVKAGSAAIF